MIEPLKHESFMASQKESFEEIGVVVELPDSNAGEGFILKRGDKIFFDSWLAAKYPNGTNGEYYWLVKFEDVRAIEKNEDEIPE